MDDVAQSITKITGALGVTLYDKQRDVIDCTKREILIAGGERAGKSFTAALYLVTRLPFGTLYWIVGPDYEQATGEFDYCVDFLAKLGAFRSSRDVSRPKIGKCVAITKTGQVIETKSSDEIKKIAMKAPDGIVMTEAAQHDHMSYMKCRGRAAERRGWLLLVGTLEGAQWYVDLLDEWALGDEGHQSFSIPSWENTFVYTGRDDPEIKSLELAFGRVPGLFEERIAATPVPASGLVFREFSRSVHVSKQARFLPGLPVYLAVDPSDGSAPYAVGAYQFIPCKCGPHVEDRIEQAYAIDEIYETGKGAEEIIDIAKKRKWWGRVKGGAIDIEAPDEQRRWKSYGGVWLHSEKIPQLHGIRREKSFLHYKTDDKGVVTVAPHLLINPKCEGLIYEYRQYKRKDPRDDDLQPAEIPPSNQPNHHIKAMWYLLVARYGFVKGRKLPGVAKNWLRKTASPCF